SFWPPEKASATPRVALASLQWAQSVLLAVGDLTVPELVVLARPAVADLAGEHGAEGALDPDRGVDVDDDRHHQHEGGEGVRQRGQADGVDTEQVAEVR